MRYRITIEYDGVGFYGWQRQKNLITIQGTIEEAIFKFSGEKVILQGGGRTDKGVHAKGQIAHFDLQKTIPPFKIQAAINYYLKPFKVIILDIEIVEASFNARFDAKKRIYLYKIINRPAPLSIDKFLAWHVMREIDLERLRQQAALLLGKHDFSSFRSSECQANNPIRSLDEIEIKKCCDEIVLVFKARSFLHSQVRIMVGTLKESALNKDFDIKQVLMAKDRKKASAPAPPYGLYLMSILY